MVGQWLHFSRASKWVGSPSNAALRGPLRLKRFTGSASFGGLRYAPRRPRYCFLCTSRASISAPHTATRGFHCDFEFHSLNSEFLKSLIRFNVNPIPIHSKVVRFPFHWCLQGQTVPGMLTHECMRAWVASGLPSHCEFTITCTLYRVRKCTLLLFRCILYTISANS